MLQINKVEPSFFTEKKRKINEPKQSSAWEELSDIRADLREYILSNEQKDMCVYCEKMITSDRRKSNIDHFKLRSLYPELTLDYNNLFVSCNNIYHCSSKKDNAKLKKDDFENIVNPIDIEENFSYTYIGEIEGKNEKAKNSIEVFGLNHKSLVEERKQIINYIEFYKETKEEILISSFNGHKNLIKFLKRNL